MNPQLIMQLISRIAPNALRTIVPNMGATALNMAAGLPSMSGFTPTALNIGNRLPQGVWNAASFAKRYPRPLIGAGAAGFLAGDIWGQLNNVNSVGSSALNMYDQYGMGGGYDMGNMSGMPPINPRTPPPGDMTGFSKSMGLGQDFLPNLLQTTKAKRQSPQPNVPVNLPPSGGNMLDPNFFNYLRSGMPFQTPGGM